MKGMAVTDRWHTGFAVLMIVGAAGCLDSTTDDLRLSSISGLYTGLTIVLNPFTCGLTGTDIHSLNALQTEGRVQVEVLFVAESADSTAVDKVASDMGLGMAHRLMTRRNFAALTESLALRSPLFVLMRRGRAVAVVSDMETRSVLKVLGLIYGRGEDGVGDEDVREPLNRPKRAGKPLAGVGAPSHHYLGSYAPLRPPARRAAVRLAAGAAKPHSEPRRRRGRDRPAATCWPPPASKRRCPLDVTRFSWRARKRGC